MKFTQKLFLAVSLLSAAQAFSHGNPNAVVMPVLLSPKVVNAGDTELQFKLVDRASKKELGDADLNITHTQALHLFVVDAGLKEFRHEHPVFKNGMWSQKVNLSVDGEYSIFMQAEQKADGKEFTSIAMITVQNGKAENSAPSLLPDVRSGEDRGSVVTLSNDTLRAKEMGMLMIDFSRRDGSKPQITPYLGAQAHVMGISLDADTLVHIHPMVMGGHFHLHVEFPFAGDYKLWVQFMDGGVLKIVPLSVKVQN